MKFPGTNVTGRINSRMTAQLFQASYESTVLATLLKGYHEAIPHYPHFTEGSVPAHCLRV